MTFKERWQKNWLLLTDFSVGKPFLSKLVVILSVLILDMIYVGLIIHFLQWLFSYEIFSKYCYWSWLNGHNVLEKIQYSVMRSLPVSILFAVILAPLWEEIAFRWYWIRKKLRNRDEDLIRKKEVITKLGPKPIYPIILITSIIFGVAHGGPINLLIQGVGGLFLAYVYLRNGRCLWSAVVLHALYNGTIIFFTYTGAWKGVAAAITMPYWILF